MAEQRKPIGGLRRVWLIPVEELREVTFAEGGALSLLLGEGISPIEVPLLEEQSLYEEECTLREGCPSVEHRLALALDRFEVEPSDVEGLQRSLSHGVVALLETLGGEGFLAGWSRRLGKEAPLRLTSLFEGSGRQRKESPSLRLILCSRDGWPALPISITENLKTNEKT